MFNLTIINLTPDARHVSRDAYLEQRNVSADALRGLLEGFCEIDPIENSAGDAEIRVNVRHEKYLLRTEQKRVVLYDVNRRDLPGQLLTVAQALVELDGSAAAARHEAVRQARADTTTAPFLVESTLPATRPEPRASKPRVIGLSVAAAGLLGAILWLSAPFGGGGVPAGFAPLRGEELDRLQGALAGVYLAGNEPGQHGIVITGPGELKLFELAAVEAPRVVYAAYRPGRVDAKLLLATDQPGGAVEVLADGSLRYGGETYRRIP